MRRHTDGANSGSTAAMWNAKGFVEIQVTNIGPNSTRRGESDLSVHVGTIHVNLSAVRMSQRTNFCNGLFEHAMRGRIGDHETGDTVRVRGEFGSQILD